MPPAGSAEVDLIRRLCEGQYDSCVAGLAGDGHAPCPITAIRPEPHAPHQRHAPAPRSNRSGTDASSPVASIDVSASSGRSVDDDAPDEQAVSQLPVQRRRLALALPAMQQELPLQRQQRYSRGFAPARAGSPQLSDPVPMPMLASGFLWEAATRGGTAPQVSGAAPAATWGAASEEGAAGPGGSEAAAGAATVTGAATQAQDPPQSPRFQAAPAPPRAGCEDGRGGASRGSGSSCLCELRGKCRHFYEALLYGVSGAFSTADVDCMRRCLGPGGVVRVERDGTVVKAEGASPEALRWLMAQKPPPPPPGQSRTSQPAASNGSGSGTEHRGPASRPSGPPHAAAAAAAAVPSPNRSSDGGGTGASGMAGSSGSGGGGGGGEERRYSVDGSPRSVPLDRLAWLQFSVGRAAEERLAAAAAVMDAAAAAAVGAVDAAVEMAEAAHAVLAGATATAAAAAAAGGVGGAVSSQQMAQSAPADAGVSGSKLESGSGSGAGSGSVSPESSNSGSSGSGTGSSGSGSSGSFGDGRPGVFRKLGRPDVSSVDVREHANASGPLLLEPGIKLDPVDRALWNLDRIDQRALPLDGVYRFGSAALRGTGQGVTIYSVDSGIYADHNEFRPWPDTAAAAAAAEEEEDGEVKRRRGSRAAYGYDFVEGDDVAADCDGHGTHVASSAVGRSVGVARGSRIVAVRVLDCSGSGTIADTVAGLDWVARNAQLPAVAMMSLGVPAGSWSTVLSDSVQSLVRKHGIVVVVASGNSAVDSCTVVPANVPEALTVAASNLENKFGPGSRGGREAMYQWANTGACVDLFAPGVEIFGACGGGDRCSAVTPKSYTWASGTSMAAPLVAGVAALYLEAHPQARPEEVVAALLVGASENVVRDERMLPGTPNRLLFSRLDALTTAPPVAAAAEGPQEEAPPAPPSDQRPSTPARRPLPPPPPRLGATPPSAPQNQSSQAQQQKQQAERQQEEEGQQQQQRPRKLERQQPRKRDRSPRP
ncbi:hypothetical protein PLESTM_000458300 [Pleodorina starrii]|nr:hypothetical protein PLESTM_000458300 [Pleodorina starrii]